MTIRVKPADRGRTSRDPSRRTFYMNLAFAITVIASRLSGSRFTSILIRFERRICCGFPPRLMTRRIAYPGITTSPVVVITVSCQARPERDRHEDGALAGVETDTDRASLERPRP